MAVFLNGDSFAEHWPDLVVAALVAALGIPFSIIAWFLKHDISVHEKRHQRAEDKFEELDEQVTGHETRITVLEERTRPGGRH